MFKSHGMLTDNIDKKLDFFTLFSNNLYQSTGPSQEEMTAQFEATIVPSINTENMQKLNCTVTENAIFQTIATMKPNKAPDPDGFILEFYKKCKSQLAPILKQVFAYYKQVKLL